MPLSMLLQLVHCAVISNGTPTEWLIPFPDDDAELDEMVAILKAQKKD